MKFRNPFKKPEPHPIERMLDLMSGDAQARPFRGLKTIDLDIAGMDFKPFGSSTIKAPTDQIVALRGYVGVPATAPERFKVGELCRPKANGHVHAQGQPHLILEVLAEPILYAPQGARSEDETPSFSKCWGQRLDMRVIHVGGHGEIHPHWVESWTMEAWPDDA